MEVTFKVSMNSEEKAAGNVEDITLDVSFEGVDASIVQKAAIAHAVVAWQSQIRSHWTEFKEDKLPSEVVFGESLFTSKRTTPVTQESATTFINNLSPEARTEMLAKLQEEV